jgi:hypothetical protein
MKIFLDKSRLKTLTDTVLLVGIVSDPPSII